jgi:N-acetylglucosamine-6-phosphate deacetylase
VILNGRFVRDERVEAGTIVVEDGWITGVEPDASVEGPLIAPGFVDLHVHGWGGHDAMGEPAALDGMARALLGRGVTAFLPTAWAASMATLAAFADRVRAWIPDAPSDGAAPLGFNLEGPFLSPERKGAHDPAHLRNPIDVADNELEPLLEGLRVMTIAPELPGAMELIGRLRARGSVASLGHSASDVAAARLGYAAGATSTTHLFNAMTGIDHRKPGLAVAALTDDDVYVELIADGQHVHPGLWPIVARTKPADRLVLVSDAISLAGTGDGRMQIGAMSLEVVGPRCTIAGTTTLAGSVIALDTAVRNLVGAGISLPAAVAAASRNPLALLGISDRGRIAVGQRADLVELDDRLQVRRVMRDGHWFAGAPG